MRFLGIVIILFALSGSAALALLNFRRAKPTSIGLPVLTLVFCFVGIVLICLDTATEISIEHIGSVRKIVDHAKVDAQTISDLRKRVEGQSAVIEVVAGRTKDAEETAKSASTALNDALKKSKAADILISQLRSELDFAQLVQSAQSGFRFDFDKLQTIASDQSNAFSTRAKQAAFSIIVSHNTGIFTSQMVPWKKDFDPQNLSLDALLKTYSDSSFTLHAALVVYIANRADIPKFDRLTFLARVVKSDDSLNAVEAASRMFNAMTAQQFNTLDAASITQWWEQNKEKFH